MQRRLNVVLAIFVAVALSGCKSNEEKIADVFSAELSEIVRMPEDRVRYGGDLAFLDEGNTMIVIRVLAEDIPHAGVGFEYLYYDIPNLMQEYATTRSFNIGIFNGVFGYVAYGTHIMARCEDPEGARLCNAVRPVWDHFYRDFGIMERRREAFQGLQRLNSAPEVAAPPEPERDEMEDAGPPPNPEPYCDSQCQFNRELLEYYRESERNRQVNELLEQLQRIPIR